ncbi:hypothetical protein HQ533_04535 [Candidatus Woesearchaeota archaeon]|nr:hypothetical protein [Candidatus Woesearchaeota archaeon]
MSNSDVHLSKKKVLELLKDASHLRELYAQENRRSSGQPYDYGSIDNIALRLFERQEGIIIIDIRLSKSNLKIHGQIGRVEENGGLLFALSETKTMF